MKKRKLSERGLLFLSYFLLSYYVASGVVKVVTMPVDWEDNKKPTLERSKARTH
jgi:hypothetical protein